MTSKKPMLPRRINAEQIRLHFLLAMLCLASFPTSEAQATLKVQGSWVELKASPLFDGERVKLSPMWGPSLPNGAYFEPEKSFGRWVYGQLAPLRYMKKKDYATKGWIYNRFLIASDDAAGAAPFSHLSHVYFYGEKFWPVTPALKSIRFLESLFLSKKAFDSYKSNDERNLSNYTPDRVSIFSGLAAPFAWPSAWGADPLSTTKNEGEETTENTFLGLSGSSFQFLNQEVKINDEKRAKLRAKNLAETLNPPKFKPLNDKLREGILARFMLSQEYSVPTLSQFEVDGHLYMRAVTERALAGCSKELQTYWSNNNWSVFRIYASAQPKKNVKNPWVQELLPDGVFTISARAISSANNEAEMAFLLIRPLVQKFYLDKNHKLNFEKDWAQQLSILSRMELERSRNLHNLKDSPTVDIADVLKIDMASIECIAKSGYSAEATLNFIKRMEFERKTDWAQGYFDFFMGNSYRLEQFKKLIADKLASKEIQESGVINARRFQESQRQWNILP